MQYWLYDTLDSRNISVLLKSEGNTAMFKNLLKPGNIGKVELKNRMVMPGMGTNLAHTDGSVSDIIVDYYARRANGGIGLVITEITCPDHAGRTPMTGELDNSSAHMKPGLSRIPHAVHSGGAKVFMQLAHGGSYAMEALNGVPALTPSGIGHMPTENYSIMTIEQIELLIQQYGEAAQRARECGFDGLELHGAHGYLPLQFLSGFTNRRTDEYGGSLENRARFPLALIHAVRKYAGEDFPLIYRLSADEDIPGGVTLEEACAFAKLAQDAGVDAIHVTAGSIMSRMPQYMDVMSGKASAEGKKLRYGIGASMWMPPSYTPRGSMIELAAAVKRVVDVPIIAVCSITPEMGEDVLEKGNADFIAFGRQSIADPDFPTKLRLGKPEAIRHCLRCNECIHSVGVPNTGIVCAVNPQAGRESDDFTKVYPAVDKKRIAVVGGGPAGMQATQTATSRGHYVTLFEKNTELGGALYYVSLPDFKLDFKDYMNHMIKTTQTCGAEIKTGIEADAEVLKDFDCVILATGAVTFKPEIKGSGDNTILDPLDVLDDMTIAKGVNIIVCGAGLVGCEVAMELALKDKNVTLVEMASDVAPDMSFFSQWVLKSYMAELGIITKVNHKIIEMTGKKITCEVEGEKTEYVGDAVICALGLKPDRKLWHELQQKLEGIEVIPVGDVNSPRKIIQAIHEGFHAARRV
jgi:2,4-dienoyl-CoA reductase-like NADH-dependent reductase (Old Yellow Enzyme family)/thioredoxin reductase